MAARPGYVFHKGSMRGMVSRVLVLLSLLVVSAWPVLAADAPPAATSDLKVTVQDQTGAALIIASVTLVDAAGTPHTLPVDDHGIATFTGLATGTYQLKADAESFQSYDGPITLKKGVNQITLTLPLAGLNEQVIVRKDTNDVRGNSFTTELTPQEIAELPDDPDELQQVLDQMAGPGATMRVNGFTGGRLPPKSQIRSIRFRMNSFDAEYHEGGGFGIDIVTKPGMDDWKGMSNFGFRDESLNARNAFAPTLAAEQYRRFGLNADGPVVKGRTSLALNFDGNNSYDSKTINATTPDGLVNGSVRTPEDRMFGSVRLDHSLSKSQQMLFEVQRNYSKRDNLGVGDFDLPSRAYTSETADTAVRFALNGTMLPKVAHELRVRFESTYAKQSSASADPTVIVQGAFSMGGAGRNSNRQAKTLEVADNIDWTIAKKHAFRAGLLGEMDWFDTTDLTNFNGTFTFGGLDRYELGLPTTYAQRLGTSAVNYTYAQLGLYIQDTWTPNKRLSLSMGVREEFQSHLDDYANFAPRLGFTWQVSKYTVRGGYGVFNDWYDSSDYQQVLLVNGVTQQDEVIRFPGYPDPAGGVISTPLPPSRILQAAGLSMPYVHQTSIGIERTVFQALRLQASYMMQRGVDQFRSSNINAPINGVYPDPIYGLVTELQSTGSSDLDRLMININYANPQRRMFFGGNYQLSRILNYTDSDFALPADSYDLAAEWGPSTRDARHRFFAMANIGTPKNTRVAIFAQGNSALPYNLTTGFDTNGDTVINDRPNGVTRNTRRGAATINLNLRLSKTFAFGPQQQTTGDGMPRFRGGPPGGGRGGPGGPGMMMMDGGTNRYKMEFYVQAFNLLNRTNFQNFVGNLSSDYFGTALAAAPARRIEVGINFGF
jgi:carboxypeptidase family protein/TonB-dependent receptor-like protein